MTFTYDLTTLIGKVRLIVGDTTAPSVFTDEELQVFLTICSSSINLASAMALEAWAAKYTANADNERIGDYSYSQNITKKMMDLAAKLKENEEGIPVLDWAEMNLTYGSGITEEED